MWPPATLFFAPEAWRWIGGEQPDSGDACSTSLEANIRLGFNRTAVTAGSNCEQPTMERIVRYMPDAVCTIANVVLKIDWSRFGVDISRSAMPLSTLSNDDLTSLQYKLKTFISPIPLGISVEDGFDLIDLSYAAESRKRRKRIASMSPEKREKVICEILVLTRAEIEKRQ